MKQKLVFLRTNILIFIFFVSICASEHVKKSVDDNRDDNGETDAESKDESLDVAVESEGISNISCSRRGSVGGKGHPIKEATTSEFPFMVAVMSHQNEYLCAGSVVSHGMILTTGKCLQQPISYVIINSSKAILEQSSIKLHVMKTEKFPTFAGGDSTRDVGIIYTEKHNASVASKLRLSDYSSANNLFEIEAIGFGLNTDVGKTKELQYVGFEHRPVYDVGDTLRGYVECMETKIPTCFRDTGGPAILNNELVGIVTKGQDECTREMTATYALHKFLVEILPTYVFKAWLDERIVANEQQQGPALVSFPAKPESKKLVIDTTKTQTLTASAAIKDTFSRNVILFPILCLAY